jgi:hypothetical protein
MMTEKVEMKHVARINVNKIHLLIKVVFDNVQVLFVNIGNTMRCQMSKVVML